MARTPRMLSRRGHAEAKAGENIGQGKPREDVKKMFLKEKDNVNAKQRILQTVSAKCFVTPYIIVLLINWRDPKARAHLAHEGLSDE